MAIKSNTTSKASKKNEVNPELQGVYINLVVPVKDADGNETVVRLNPGVSAGLLKIEDIFPSMNDEIKTSRAINNKVVDQLHAKGIDLEPGESIMVDQLSLELYRRKEVMDDGEITTPDINLFGDEA